MSDFFLDIDCQQQCKHKQFIYGDVFASRKVKEEKRIILVWNEEKFFKIN